MRGRSEDRAGTELEERVARWRSAHGGRGVRWPAELWTAVIAAARVEGVASVAKRLGLARERLAARVSRAETVSSATHSAPSGFVEVEARRLYSGARTVIRLEDGAGSKVELELGDGDELDVVALAQAFWSRGG